MGEAGLSSAIHGHLKDYRGEIGIFQSCSKSFLTAKIQLFAFLDLPSDCRADRLVREFDEQVLSDSDVLVLPVMPIVTPTADRCDPTSDRFSARTLYALSRWTRFVNMLGFPAVAMPAGLDDNGMPVGVQIVGRAGTDLVLLDLVRHVQAITSWHAHVPDAVAHLLFEVESLS